MSVSALKKKTLAQAAAAVVVVALVGGGYVGPMCSYSTMLEQSRSFIENFINQNMIAADATPFSVDLYEDDIGLFSHDVTFIATDGDVKLKVPVKISVTYGGYDYDIDLVQATINDANAIKSFDLNTLTALNLSASYSLCQDKGQVQLSASYLNDDVSLYALAEYQKYLREHISDEQEQNYDGANFPSFENGIEGAVAQLKERIAYKPVGTMNMQLGFDQDENFTLDFTLDHALSNYASISELSYHSQTQGFLQLKNIGRNDLSFKRFALLGMSPMVVEDVTFKSEGSRPNKAGVFNLPYELKIGSARLLKNLNFTGTIAGLSLSTLNSPEEALSNFSTFLPHPVTVSVDPGSRFDYVTMVRPDEYSKAEQQQLSVELSGHESIEVKDWEYGQYLDLTAQGDVTVNTDVSLITGRSLLPLMPLFEQFKVNKDGTSHGTIDFHSGRPDEMTTITVNGNKI